MSMEMESMWGAMKSVHYQRVVSQLERSLKNTTKLKDALTAALDTVVAAVHAQAGTFWYYDRYGDGRIHPEAVYGGGDLSGVSLLPGEGIAGQVVDSGKPVIVADCKADPRWAGKVDAKTGFRTESMICVPVTLGTQTFGSIQIINKTDSTCFDEKELEFAQRLAGAAAELLYRQGVLDGVEAEEAGGRASQITFMQVFGAESSREMEHQLRSVEEFAALRVSEQEEVLRLARELQKYFGLKHAGRFRRH